MQQYSMAIEQGESPHLRLETGGFIAGHDNRSAFSLRAHCSPPIPVVIAVPHAGRDYPSSLLSNMRDPEFACLKLEDRYIDLVAQSVAEATGATLIVAQAPRAMLDLNRARDDVDWDMVAGMKPPQIRHSQANRRARSGLGLVPRRLPGFGEIWRGKLARSELDRRIEGIHQPYHAAITRELERLRDEWGAALLVDLHSMPPLRASSERPEPVHFVIGDRFGTACDADLVACGYRFLESNGSVVSHNRPYAGGFVLETHASPPLGIHAVQLEVCRSIYLDARLEYPTARIASLARLLAGLVREMGGVAERLGRGGNARQAAE